MKKILFLVLSAALVVISGCVSSKGGNQEIASAYEQYKQSLPPAEWQPTGIRSLDDIGILSAQVYQQTYQYLQEYISATENNRYYIGLMNEVDRIKETEQLEDFAALQKAFNNIAEADKNRPEGEALVLPKVIEGYNAVQALKPSNKLLSLTPMLPQIADLIVRAKNIPNEIKAELSRDPIKAIAVGKSAKNVLIQLYHTQKLAQYIKMQYDRNQEMAKYMQD